MRVQRRDLYRARPDAVVRLARSLGVAVPTHGCSTCQFALVERMARHEAIR